MACFFSRKNEQLEQISRQLVAVCQNQQSLLQSLTEELRKVSKNIETVHNCVDRLHAPLAQLHPLIETVKQLQEKIENISPSTPPAIHDGTLDEHYANRINTTSLATNAAERQQAAAHTWEKELSVRNEEISKGDNEYHAVIKSVLSHVVRRETEPIQAVPQDHGRNNT